MKAPPLHAAGAAAASRCAVDVQGRPLSDFAQTFGASAGQVVGASGWVVYVVSAHLRVQQFLAPLPHSLEMRAYLEECQSLDPLAPARCLPTHQYVATLQSVMSMSSLDDLRYRMSFTERFGIVDALEIYLLSGAGLTIGCSLIRHAGRVAFTAEDCGRAIALRSLGELALAQLLPSRQLGEDRLKARFPSVTAGELRLMQLVAMGLSNRDVAESLGIAVPTVKSHLLSIFRKLDVKSRAELTSRMLL